eukprot:11163650-Lingulodinium_polyedra.AAC.1
MMRSNRPFAATTARKLHARAILAHANSRRAHETRACILLTAVATNGRIDHIVTQRTTRPTRPPAATTARKLN